MFIIQVNDNDGVLKELCYIGFNRERCEQEFLKVCAESVSDWNDLGVETVDAILDNGFVEFDLGAVVFIDASNCITDNEILDQLTKQSDERVSR